MTGRAARAGLIGLLVVWAGLSCARLSDWQSNQALWGAAVEVAPTTRAMVNYASALMETNQWEAAIPWLIQLDASTDPRARPLWTVLLRRAQQLAYPVCDVSVFASVCAS